MEEVIKAGATTVNIPDTVGYNFPCEFGSLIADIKANTRGIENVIISTHCQNDLGLASANTLAVILVHSFPFNVHIHVFSLSDIQGSNAGARQLEVTVNGIGERAGNASLEEVFFYVHQYLYKTKYTAITDDLCLRLIFFFKCNLIYPTIDTSNNRKKLPDKALRPASILMKL